MGLLKRIFAALLPFLAAPLLASPGDIARGMEAYRDEDWASAEFFIRKYLSDASFEDAGDDVVYILIKSSFHAGDYEGAQADCAAFLGSFPESRYRPLVLFQNGKLLHLLGRNDSAVLALCDFCQLNPGHELYPDALFWIAEAFFDEYDFESARGLYTRVVSDFASNRNVPAAKYKLDLISRRSREEKLLYLLRVTGEENLSAREEYERQLRIYRMEDRAGLQKMLKDARDRVPEPLPETPAPSAEDVPREPSASAFPSAGELFDYEAEIEMLRRKAWRIQQIMSEREDGASR